MSTTRSMPDPFTPDLVEAFVERLGAGRSFRRSWPGVGRLYVDRLVPAPVLPRSLEMDDAAERLERTRRGCRPYELLES